MKTIFTLICFLTITITTFAKQKNESTNPIVGTWKFSSQSSINDFQKVFKNDHNYQTELFVFEPNHTFNHDFVDNAGNLVKSLNGKWKLIGDKIKIEYSNIDYSMTIGYFYIGKDLILGQNFNHVIFTKENVDFQNVAAK